MPEASNHRKPKEARPIRFPRLSIFWGYAKFFLVILWVSSRVRAWSYGAFETEPTRIIASWMALWLLFAITRTWSAGPIERGRRALMLSGDQAIKNDPRSPIVYLRSFASDALAREQRSATQEPEHLADEEALVAMLVSEGPVVAVGHNPSHLILRGAARFEVEDADWQNAVLKLMKDAQAILVRLDDTQGVLWEVETLFREVAVDRIYLLLPSEDRNFEKYRQVRAVLMERQIIELPERPFGEIVAFEPKQEAPQVVFVRIGSHGNYETRLERGFKPFLADRGYFKKPRKQIGSRLMLPLALACNLAGYFWGDTQAQDSVAMKRSFHTMSAYLHTHDDGIHR